MTCVLSPFSYPRSSYECHAECQAAYMRATVALLLVTAAAYAGPEAVMVILRALAGGAASATIPIVASAGPKLEAVAQKFGVAADELLN